MRVEIFEDRKGEQYESAGTRDQYGRGRKRLTIKVEESRCRGRHLTRRRWPEVESSSYVLVEAQFIPRSRTDSDFFSVLINREEPTRSSRHAVSLFDVSKY